MQKTLSAPAQELPQKRIDCYDIAKGIGIFLVAYAHSRGPLANYAYFFHMPMFFLISGLLYNAQAETGAYILGKVKRLYLPFVFWNVLFYTVKSLLRGKPFKWILKMDLLIALTLEKDGEFLGATWFLGALFLVSVGYKLLDTAMRSAPDRDLALVALCGVLTVVAMQITFPYLLSRTAILSLYFAVGVFVKNRKDRLAGMDSFGMALACGCLLILIGSYGTANMGANSYLYPLQFVLGAFCGSYAVLYFSRFLDRCGASLQPVKKCMIYLGRHSMDIVLWQFVVFRLVVMLQMYLNGEELTVRGILSYYPVYSTDGLWWAAYFLVGLLAPLGVSALLRAGPWGKLLRKMHIV